MGPSYNPNQARQIPGPGTGDIIYVAPDGSRWVKARAPRQTGETRGKLINGVVYPEGWIASSDDE